MDNQALGAVLLRLQSSQHVDHSNNSSGAQRTIDDTEIESRFELRSKLVWILHFLVDALQDALSAQLVHSVPHRVVSCVVQICALCGEYLSLSIHRGVHG